METLAIGAVVLVRFPFSDLSGMKVRPALVLADSGNQDWILCQITSNPYSDLKAMELDNDSFELGSLQRISYVRPGKLFTANLSIIKQPVGFIKKEVLRRIYTKVVEMFTEKV